EVGGFPEFRRGFLRGNGDADAELEAVQAAERIEVGRIVSRIQGPAERTLLEELPHGRSLVGLDRRAQLEHLAAPVPPEPGPPGGAAPPASPPVPSQAPVAPRSVPAFRPRRAGPPSAPALRPVVRAECGHPPQGAEYGRATRRHRPRRRLLQRALRGRRRN